MAKIKNPFDVFKPEVKTAHIKALNANITYRELTIRELDKFNKSMVESYDAKTNEPKVDMDIALDVKYEKVSAMLVEPEMSVEALKELNGHAQDAIEEIIDLLTPEDTELLDEEGN